MTKTLIEILPSKGKMIHLPSILLLKKGDFFCSNLHVDYGENFNKPLFNNG